MKYLTYILLLFTCQTAIGQSVLISTPSSGGGKIIDTEISLEFSIGQPFVELRNQDEIQISEGIFIGQFSQIISHLEKFYTQTEISIFPNPANDYIKYKGWDQDESMVEIYNSIGEKMLAIRHKSENQININHIPNGQYFLVINGKNHFASSSFVKI